MTPSNVRVTPPGTPDRAAGVVLGLALGDALGAPFESSRANAIPDPLPALELPWRGGPSGSTTDDTAMALNLATSLVDRGGFDGGDVLRRHVAWFRSDPPDVGSLTRRVLHAVADGRATAEDAARLEWERRGPEVSAGNGSVMYCAPLGVAYANRPEALVEAAPSLSALTHYDERCRTACLAVALATAGLLRGSPARAAVAEALRSATDLPGGEELEFLTEAVGRSRPIDGPDQGFCLYAAAAGLQAVLFEDGFGESLTRVVRLGGDTDTNAAVAGALLGARDGRSRLPDIWLARLRVPVAAAEIQRLTDGLAALAAVA
jgi:ADP-ribosyl-[dinitrogen reductase] hydrolase